jgi:hypothetical protein
MTIRRTARSLASQGASKATQRQAFPTLVIPLTYTEVLAGWMAKGVSTADAKVIQS